MGAACSKGSLKLAKDLAPKVQDEEEAEESPEEIIEIKNLLIESEDNSHKNSPTAMAAVSAFESETISPRLFFTGGYEYTQGIRVTLHNAFVFAFEDFGYREMQTDINFARFGHSFAVTSAGLFTYGGNTGRFTLNSGSFQKLDSIKSKPLPKIDSPGYRNNARTIPVGDTVFIFGGCTDACTFATAFDINQFRWIKFPELTKSFEPGFSVTAYQRDGVQFALAVGIEKSAGTALVVEFNLSEFTQNIVTANTKVRTDHSAALVDNKIYVIGGRSGAGKIQTSIEVLDLSTMTWSQETSFAKARYKAQSFAIGKYIYIVDGLGLNDKAPDTIYKYDPTSKVFEEIPYSSDCIEVFNGAWTLYKDKLYILGGEYYDVDSKNQATQRGLYEFDPATLAWTHQKK